MEEKQIDIEMKMQTDDQEGKRALLNLWRAMTENLSDSVR
mgnify:CR=1 FL=1